jgi:hypothetical protein
MSGVSDGDQDYGPWCELRHPRYFERRGKTATPHTYGTALVLDPGVAQARVAVSVDRNVIVSTRMWFGRRIPF